MIFTLRRSFLVTKNCHIKQFSYYPVSYYPGSLVSTIICTIIEIEDPLAVDDAGVVDEDGDGADLRLDPLARGVDVGALRQVARVGVALPAEGLDSPVK